VRSQVALDTGKRPDLLKTAALRTIYPVIVTNLHNLSCIGEDDLLDALGNALPGGFWNVGLERYICNFTQCIQLNGDLHL
jgi:hypothetical protein